MSEPFKQLQEALAKFACERDWDQFHSPKNLAMALTVEAAELQECFQWLTEEQSRTLDTRQMAAVREEIADVQLYLIQLAGKIGVDIESACWEKLSANAHKYPAERARGRADKYTHYEDEPQRSAD